MTLETIGKLSDMLHFELITFPDFEYGNMNKHVANLTAKVKLTQKDYNLKNLKQGIVRKDLNKKRDVKSKKPLHRTAA